MLFASLGAQWGCGAGPGQPLWTFPSNVLYVTRGHCGIWAMLASSSCGAGLELPSKVNRVQEATFQGEKHVFLGNTQFLFF